MADQAVTIYTDGGCKPNPGFGGWASILLYTSENGAKHEKRLTGNAKYSTNNKMELTAILEGLKALKRPCHVTIYSDSKYAVESIGSWKNGTPCRPIGWLVKWNDDGWKKKKGELKNIDIFKQIHILAEKQLSLTMRWVKGHDNDYYNELCDSLANEACDILINDVPHYDI